jgi:pimeloyl-ACP methyl ester carboxylesterase
MEIFFHKGNGKKPLIVFIHGMGMNVKAWSDPSQATILAGKYPLRVFFEGADSDFVTSFNDLKALDYSLLSWTQSRPAGPIMIAVRELEKLLDAHARYADKGIVFVGHSRGGLIARKYIENSTILLRGLITLSTPHHGTSLAQWAKNISPLTAMLGKFLDFRKKDVNSALIRVLGFLGSAGLRELHPGSLFYSRLKDNRKQGARYVSIGGTNPDILRALSISIPALISRIIPEKRVPEEMRDGLGDGLVSAASSVLTFADEHLNFNVNHGSILFDKEVRSHIVKTVESL